MNIIGRTAIKFKQGYWRLGIICIAIFLTLLGAWQFSLKSFWLTYRHGSEIRIVLNNYEKIINSLSAFQNPTILKEVLTGEHLDFLQGRCYEGCSTVQITENVNIDQLKILDYKSNSAKVFARVEIAWVVMRLETQEIEGPCQASAVEGIYRLVKEDEQWKVLGGEKMLSDTWTPLEELRSRVCPHPLP